MLNKILNTMRLACCNQVIIRGVLLKHLMHRFNIINRVSPVAARLQIAQGELLLQAELDAGNSAADFTRHKLQAAARRLMIEKNTAAGEQTIAFAIIGCDVMRKSLRDTVRAARV